MSRFFAWVRKLPTFRLHEFLEDECTRRMSVTRLISLGAAMVMAYRFWNHGGDFLNFALAMAASGSPALMSKFVGLKFGSTNGAPAPTPQQEVKA